MAARVTHAHFERFAQHRLEFVRNIAALAEREEYLEVRRPAEAHPRRFLRQSSHTFRPPRPHARFPFSRPQSLLDEDAFGALKILLNDRVPTIQQTAALAVGRMASFSVEVAEALASCGILEQLSSAMRESTLAGHLKACAFVLKSVARHTPELAGAALAAGAGAALTHALSLPDPSVREAAAQAAAALAQHTGEQAAALLTAGAHGHLVAALAEPEPALRRAAAGALAEVAKHEPELAGAVVEAGALPALVALLRGEGERGGGGGVAPPPPPAGGDAAAKVHRAAASALSAIAKHSAALAEAAVEARLFPLLLVRLVDGRDEGARRAAAVAVREVVKHSEQLAAVVVEAGGVGSLVEYLSLAGAWAPPAAPPAAALAAARATAPDGSRLAAPPRTTLPPGSGAPGAAPAAFLAAEAAAGDAAGAARGAARLPAVMALGFIAAYGEVLALRVVECSGVGALKAALLEGGAEEHVRAAAVWALGQVGKHSPSPARAVAAADALRHVSALLAGEGASDDVRDKARRCLGAVLAVCDHVPAMVALLPAAPPLVAKLVLRQLGGAVLAGAGGGEARRAFLASGALKVVQRLDPTARAAIAAHGPAALRTYTSALGAGAFAPGAAGSAMAAVAVGGGDEELADLVAAINALYPPDVVAYCRPEYGLGLLDRTRAAVRAEEDAEKEARAAARVQLSAAEGV
jgi:hypothetical protein